VIWVEVVQLGIYLVGAAMAALVLVNAINGGWGQAMSLGQQYNKFSFIDLGFRDTVYAFTAPLTSRSFTFTLPVDLTKTYTLWAGLLGGCFLTMSTHGTDQYLVQRYLCTDKPRHAAAALLSSGGVVLGQFIGFLFIGVLLFAFYGPHTDSAYGTLANGVATLPSAGMFKAVGGDRVFPDFITKFMPSGLSGLVVAAIFAAALSSSLNSIAATAVNDLYKPFRPKRDDKHYLRVSHWLTLVWGLVQIGVALVVMRKNRSALDQALSVASLINGPVLGVFLVGTFLRRVSEPPALIGMVASIVVMTYIRFWTPIAWTWYVLIGSLVTFVVAWLAGFAFPPATSAQRDELSPTA